MSVKDRGFGSMDPDKQRSIAGMGGKKAHAIGKAHKWTKEDASNAGKLGGKVLKGSKYK
jgi:hypothetical protein